MRMLVSFLQSELATRKCSLKGASIMTTVGESFWAEIDRQVSGDTARRLEVPAPSGHSPAAVLLKSVPESEPVRLPVAAPEWSGILDIINDARARAEFDKDQLLEQARLFQQALTDLRQENDAIRQQVRISEARADEMKQEADRYVNQILAQTEDRVLEIQAKANDRIAQAGRSVRIAEERAAAAEGWLQRIGDAAKSLGQNRQAPAIQRAA